MSREIGTERGPDTRMVKRESQSLAQSVRQRPAIAPACDIYENDDEILVIADVPGVTADSLDINLEKGELMLEARRENAGQQGNFLGKELWECDFRRRFAVPGGIDADKISAELRDGVLHLHLPKSEALKPRQIPVQAG
jgi:HSP20 family protein